MSAAAVTATPPVNSAPPGPTPPRQSARKRTTAVATRTVNRELVTEEDLNLSQTAEFGYGKDLSHTIRGETVLDAQPNHKVAPNHRDAQAKRILKSPRPKGSKPNSSSSESKWHLLGKVFTKTLLLFILATGLGSTLWHWSTETAPSADTAPAGILSSEGRFAELEGFLKKTTKLMQVQLELVDMKIGKQVENLRKELEEKIEEQTAAFLSELRSLQVQTADIEESLAKLRDSGILSKQEVLSLVHSVVDMRAAEGDGQALSLDDVRAVARRIVEAEIERHSADGLGRVDYALGAGGGKVVRHSEGYFLGKGRSWGFGPLDLLIKNAGGIHPFASKMLEPSFGEPGQCLPLKGSTVFVDIALRTSIFPEAVTLEHVAKSVAYDKSSAPKDFRILGWLDHYKEDASEEVEQMLLLGQFSYDLEKSSAQTFDLPVESTGKLVNMIKLDVLSNHGSSSHTCIYRLRVHGSDPKSFTPTAKEA